MFSVFKQYYMYFHILFHPHVFQKKKKNWKLLFKHTYQTSPNFFSLKLVQTSSFLLWDGEPSIPVWRRHEDWHKPNPSFISLSLSLSKLMASMAELQTCITTTSYVGSISEPNPFSFFFSNLDLTCSLSLHGWSFKLYRSKPHNESSISLGWSCGE